LNTRREFLERLFALLEERRTAYVVLRNFDSVFDEGTSDVDLLAEDRDAVFAAGQAAARATGHRLVQSAPFTCQSWVWWNGSTGFVRVDVDTDLRWRWLQGPSTAGILERRVRRGAFYIPAPHDEADALRVKLATRGLLEERYVRRLIELGAPAVSAARKRRRLLVSNLLNPLRWPGILRHLASDVRRYVVRRRSPAGIAVRVVTARDFDADAFAGALAGLFPTMKRAGGIPREIRRARFTGGLALDVRRVESDEALAPAARGSGADFTAMIESSGCLHAAHAPSGAMTSAGEGNPADALAAFICECLARVLDPRAPRRGLAVVLAGVDGAGKTTFARNLCALAVEPGRYAGCRYFHFIPPLRGPADFPWPVFTDQSRHRGDSSPLASALRLIRNVVRARVAWTFRVAPLLRAGRLVVLDRFVANYWLDPESVRFSGPRWLLLLAQRLIPKPDLLIALDAEAEVLHRRKGELALDEIHAQQRRLRELPALAGARMDLDAARPAAVLARSAFEQLSRM
jgi:hypothetical protein